MESEGGEGRGAGRANAALNPLAGPVIHFSGLNMEKDTGAGRRKPNVFCLIHPTEGSATTRLVLPLPQILFVLYQNKTVETSSKG